MTAKKTPSTKAPKKSTAKKAPAKKPATKTQPARKQVQNLAVMDKLKEENVKMRPSWHFGVLGFALGLAVILIGFFASILMSAIVDEVRDASSNDLFELQGSGAIVDFPWLLLLLAIAAIMLSYRLIKRLDFSYKHRSYIMFGSLALILILGATFFSAIDASRSFRTGPLQRLSTFSQFAEEKVLRGEVVEITEESVILDGKGRQFSLEISDDVDGYELIEEGMRVVLIGSYTDDEGFEVEVIKPDPAARRGVKGIFNQPKTSNKP